MSLAASLRRHYGGILRPSAYHGPDPSSPGEIRRPFFEGWYCKLSTPEGPGCSIIVGAHLPDSTLEGAKEAHAFIMVLQPGRPEAIYIERPFEALRASRERLDVQLPGLSLTESGIRLELPEIEGEVSFDNLSHWPVSLASPGVMGWYGWVPAMECYHGVVSMDHALHGTLKLEDTALRFDGGRGYLEKDWGRRFPSDWVWLQAHGLRSPHTSVFASVANVPWQHTSFPGVLCGLWHEGQLHRMCTYLGTRVERLERTEEALTLTLVDHRHRMELRAFGGEATQLWGPEPGGMTKVIHEHLGGQLELRWTEKRSGRILFEGTSRDAAFEAEGDLTRLGG